MTIKNVWKYSDGKYAIALSNRGKEDKVYIAETRYHSRAWKIARILAETCVTEVKKGETL